MRHFDTELQALKDKLVQMGGYVERAVQESTQALMQRDRSRFESVFQAEAEINRLQVEVDDDCVQLLARQSPMANDLRMVIAILKINSDLERMGDQAVNITHNSRHYLEGPDLKPLVDLPLMADKTKLMVRQALDAFVRTDVDLARQVLESDDAVDELRDRIFKDLMDLMKSKPNAIEQGINLILVARNLERLADHATNIAEDVIYAKTGKDVRHGGADR